MPAAQHSKHHRLPTLDKMPRDTLSHTHHVVGCYTLLMLKHEFNNYGIYLKRILIVRCFILAAFTLLIVYGIYGEEKNLNLPWILGIMLSWIAMSILFLRRKNTPISETGLLWHILADVLAMTGLLYFTGGYTNPLISCYLFPVLIAGLTLSRRMVWLIGTIVILAYILLFRFYIPLPLLENTSTMASEGFHFHLLGMWLTFLLSVWLIISVLVHMVEERRLHEQQLAEIRQKALHNKEFVALGAQAAFDAHEMGTPINTLLLLLEELDVNGGKTEQQTVALMQQQLLHCRNILQRLSQRARILSHMHTESAPLHLFLSRTAAQWVNLHPTIQVTIPAVKIDSPSIEADPTLAQVLFILLDNAMEANATRIDMRATWDNETVSVQVEDNGYGFKEGDLKMAGHYLLTSKSHGQGMGLYLARFIMQEMGGKIYFSNTQGSGACVHITWAKK